MVKQNEENGITTIKIVQEVCIKTCPECDKEISGVNRKQLVWNFNVHHQACKRKLKKQKEKKE